MRSLSLVLMLGLAGPAAAQLTEEVMEVPTSQASRDAEQARIDAEAGAEGVVETAGDWREIASAYDIERIEGNDAGFARALEVAKTSGSPADQAELKQVLAPLPDEIDLATLPGRWQCRTIRFVEEPANFRVYDWFDCQISALSDGLLLEKLGGSELTSGFLYSDTPTRMIYLGHAHSRNAPARDYDGDDGAIGDDPANPDDPGILTQRGEGRLLLAKPSPVGPPDYDYLELRRP